MDSVCLFIENSKNTAIGHIRFKRNLDLSCTLTVYLFPDETGKGLGVKAIKCGCNCVYKAWGNIEIMANVRDDNVCAKSAFKKAGFIDKKPSLILGHVTLKYKKI